MAEVRDWLERINDIATGYVRSQVLFAAVEGHVFELLETPRSAEDVAAQRNWDRRGTRMLLDGLLALGLVEKQDGLYRNTPLASACLVPGGAAYQGHIIRHHMHGAPLWQRLGEAVRTGKGMRGERRERSPEELRDFILGMSDIAKFSVEEVLKAYDFSVYHSLLDAGGGPATYSIGFLNKYPNLQATVFDLPEVIPIAREQAGKAGLEGRMSFLPGDLNKDDLGEGYDLVLVSNIIHSLSPDQNRALVRKCYEAMISGGLLVIKDFLVDNERTGPPFSLLFALRMLLGTGAGDAYTFAEVEQWTHNAGFRTGRALDLTAQSRLWLAEK